MTTIPYRRCGRSGLDLPAVSLGLWHNFGHDASHDVARQIVGAAFDLGITHFDLANNYGPPPGSAEESFGKILASGFGAHRDEMIISTKAGYRMWPGPYGDGGSRKYLLASLDASLLRMGLDYVDIFYHHRPDPSTPMEESLGALDHAVRSGRALYAGISSYSPADTTRAAQILAHLGTPCLIHQPRYNLFDRRVEQGLLEALEQTGMGAIAFSPLDQGILAGKYLQGISQDSRAAKGGFLKPDQVTEDKINKVRQLAAVAAGRGQTVAQLALAWTLRHPGITSALIGASRPTQVVECAECLEAGPFTDEELTLIDDIAGNAI